MKKALIVLSAFAFLSVVAFSCAKSDSPEPISPSACDNIPKNFTTDVNPIIQTYCNQAACHNPGSINGPGPLTNYTEIFNARTSIKGQVQAGLMPQNTTLTTAQKNIIICWIDSGAPNN
jgi:hypothetical protein